MKKLNEKEFAETFGEKAYLNLIDICFHALSAKTEESKDPSYHYIAVHECIDVNLDITQDVLVSASMHKIGEGIFDFGIDSLQVDLGIMEDAFLDEILEVKKLLK